MKYLPQRPASEIPNSPPPAALIDVLDRVLDKGVVIAGQLTISVAGVDLLDIDLNLSLASPDHRAGLRLRPSGMQQDQGN